MIRVKSMSKRKRPLQQRMIDFYKRKVIDIRKLLYKPIKIKSSDIDSVIDEFKKKEKIIVLCSGPSAAKVNVSADFLYITTNDSFKLVRELDYLFYLYDPYYLRQNAFKNIHKKINQPIFFSYFDKRQGQKKSFDYFKNILHLIKSNNKFIIDDRFDDLTTRNNYLKFSSFLNHHKIDLKLSNSGIFLLMLGYYYSMKMNLPLEIYGLDLGIGGHIHFDKTKNVTKAITRNSVKVHVREYLDYMYNNHHDIKNYSNFYGNMTGFKEE